MKPHTTDPRILKLDTRGVLREIENISLAWQARGLAPNYHQLLDLGNRARALLSELNYEERIR